MLARVAHLSTEKKEEEKEWIFISSSSIGDFD